jgi:hypothetical protein
MTDLTFFDIPAQGIATQTRATQLSLPKPVMFGPPVFINDVASPLAGQTVLLMLLGRCQPDE